MNCVKEFHYLSNTFIVATTYHGSNLVNPSVTFSNKILLYNLYIQGVVYNPANINQQNNFQDGVQGLSGYIFYIDGNPMPNAIETDNFTLPNIYQFAHNTIYTLNLIIDRIDIQYFKFSGVQNQALWDCNLQLYCEFDYYPVIYSTKLK